MRTSSCRMVPLCAFLALVSAQTALGAIAASPSPPLVAPVPIDFFYPPPTEAKAAPSPPLVAPVPIDFFYPPPKAPSKCKSFYEVLKATPSLSNLYKTVSMVPEIKKLLSNKNAKWTFIAPTNKAIKKPSSKLNKAQAADLLKQHILKGVLANKSAWVSTNKIIPRLAGKPVTTAIAVSDNFKEGISTYIIYLNVNDKSTGVRLYFPSNKPDPAIPTCQGVVYTSDIAFPYVKTVKG